jgi:predicted PurR-regulated permease PerM
LARAPHPLHLLAKPGFASWLLVVAAALLAYLQYLPALVLALIMAVVCRPLYEWLFHGLSRVEALRRRPALAHRLASACTQCLACLILVVGVLAPLTILSQNRKVILSSADSAYSAAREWSRSQIQALGSRLHIQEWNDFDALPLQGDPPPVASPGVFRERSLQDKLVELVSRPIPFLPFVLKTLGGGALLLGQLMIFVLALHFLLLHGRSFWEDVLLRCPPAWRGTLTSLGRRSRMVLMSTCVVHGLTALSAFLLALPVFWFVVGREHFVLMAMLAGCFQFIPLLGSATLLSLMTLYSFATGNAVAGWQCVFLAFPVIAGLPDLVVRPYLAARYGKVHSMTMLAGFVTGFEIFGLLGFVLGPLFLDLVVQFTNQVLGHHQAVKAPLRMTLSPAFPRRPAAAPAPD